MGIHVDSTRLEQRIEIIIIAPVKIMLPLLCPRDFYLFNVANIPFNEKVAIEPLIGKSKMIFVLPFYCPFVLTAQSQVANLIAICRPYFSTVEGSAVVFAWLLGEPACPRT